MRSRILDPACGSGHFLLYCFGLLLIIYEEAYDDPDLGPKLYKRITPRRTTCGGLPGLILRHNLHGIDIDLRARPDRRSRPLAAVPALLVRSPWSFVLGQRQDTMDEGPRTKERAGNNFPISH